MDHDLQTIKAGLHKTKVVFTVKNAQNDVCLKKSRGEVDPRIDIKVKKCVIIDQRKTD